MHPLKTIFLASGPPAIAVLGRRRRQGPGRPSGNWSCLVVGPGPPSSPLPGHNAAHSARKPFSHHRTSAKHFIHSPANTSSSGLILLIFRVSNCLMTEDALMEVSTMPDSCCTSSFLSTSGSS